MSSNKFDTKEENEHLAALEQEKSRLENACVHLERSNLELGQAIDAGTYARAADTDTELLVFSCSGLPAKAFYDGLVTRSQAMGSEYVVEGRTLRTTEPLQRDRFGADGCSWDGATDWRCDIALRTGTFLTDTP